MTTGEKIREWLKSSLGYAAIALLSCAYVATALFRMNETGKSVETIIADGVAYLLLGVAFEQLFSIQGMMNGERDERVLATASEHAAAVSAVLPWMHRLDAWCVMKTKEALRTLRERLLLRRGMSYEHYFDAEGHALPYRPVEIPSELLPVKHEPRRTAKLRRKRRKNFEREEHARYRCYLAAMRLSVTPLVSGALTGLGVNRDDPYDFGEDTAHRMARMARKSAVWRLITAALFGYYGIGLIQVFSVYDLLYKLFQVALALALGVASQHSGYIYVTEERRGKTIRKIDTLQMFAAEMKNAPAELREMKEGECHV